MITVTPYPLSHQMPHEKEREGIVAWDQKGLVVLWPDGHRSRFSWLALRQACQCLECQKQKKESATDADHLVQFYALF